jgi:hypothetical protein
MVSERDQDTRDEVIFVNRVAGALGALGYRVRPETLLAGTRFDLLADTQAPAIGAIRLAVECKYRSTGNVSREDVAKFVHDLTSSARGFDRGLVVTTHGLTPAAYAVADAHGGIELRTLADLHSDLLDAAPSLIRITQEYEESDASRQYVPLRG